MSHLVEKDTLLKVNSVMILLLVGGGLAACAVGAVIVDVARVFGVW
jgi:hypothetical protein